MSKNLETLHRMRTSSLAKDYDTFLDCLTDDIEYYWHMGTKPVSGMEKMQKFIKNYTSRFEQRQWEIHTVAENGDLLMAEGLEVLYDKTHDREIRQPFMNVLEFRDGKVAKMRDYYEAANLQPPAEAAAKS